MSLQKFSNDSRTSLKEYRIWKCYFIQQSVQAQVKPFFKISLLYYFFHWIRYYDTVYERDGINYFWSIKNSNDVLNKFKSKKL